MGKYTRYSSNYPTKYANWMYPPKNVGLFQYMTMSLRGYGKALGPNITASWTYLVAFVPTAYLVYWISKTSKGSKFCQSVKDTKGNWIYGPPSEKLLQEHHEIEILHASHK